MLRDDAINLIALRLGDRDDLSQHILAEMKLIQEELEEDAFLPWFLLSERATEETVVGEERIALPDDFLMEYEHGTLWVLDETLPAGSDQYVRLVKRDYETIRRQFPDTGRPEAYAVLNEYFRLRPIPDNIYTLQMLYWQRDLVLDTNIENKWLKHASDLLIAKTGLRVASYIQNGTMMQLFGQEVSTAASRLLVKHEARMHANMDYWMNPEMEV